MPARTTFCRVERGPTCSMACARPPPLCLSDDVPRNADDMAAGFRHLLVLLGIGLDNALREGSGSVLAVKPSGVDAIY